MRSELFSRLDVSRETVETLEGFVALLVRWNEKINLVSRLTTADIWVRHVEDSAQILLHAPTSTGHWLDLGSGGGLPGLVISIIGLKSGRISRVTLVESDQRKCAFLSEAARKLSLPVDILNKRIEDIDPQKADVVTARALTDLSGLLSYSHPHIGPNSTLLFPKGGRHALEITEAQKNWQFTYVAHPSATQPDAAVLEIQNVARRTKE